MNGNDQNYQPNPELPPPQAGNRNPLAGQKLTEQQASRAEAAGQQAEQSPSPPVGATPAMPIPPALSAAPVAISNDNTAHATTSIPVTDAPEVADDADLIEKEWVSKAKAIVASTKEDPHNQNKQLNKFKADYIQKRYNKQLKVSEN